MTATTSKLGTRSGQITVASLRRLALGAGSFLAAIGSRWSDFVDAGQLGPNAETMTSRHTGARI